MMIGTTFSVQPYSDDIQFHFAINGIGRAVTFICQTCKSHNACVEEGRPVFDRAIPKQNFTLQNPFFMIIFTYF